jgi:hypothetical protein
LLWAKNVDAISTAAGRDSPLTLDFKDDILENLDAALAMRGEASNGTWTFFLEYNYAKLDPSIEASAGPVLITADVDFEDVLVEGGAYLDYRFRGWGSVFFGYRYIDIDFDNGSCRFDQYGFDGDEQGPVLGLNLYF